MDIEIRKIDPKDILVPTRLLHESLTHDQSAFSRYTFKHAGKHLYPCYEQWENGFLRERDLDAELMFWMRVSAVLIRLKAEGKRAIELIGEMCVGLSLERPTRLTRKILEAWEGIQADGCESYIREALSEAAE